MKPMSKPAGGSAPPRSSAGGSAPQQPGVVLACVGKRERRKGKNRRTDKEEELNELNEVSKQRDLMSLMRT